MLALIVERNTGRHFAQAMQQLVFAPAGMENSGADDDGPMSSTTAVGQNVIGEFGLRPASAIHWSALPGNGSDYSTIRDISRWLDVFLSDRLLRAGPVRSCCLRRPTRGTDGTKRASRSVSIR